MNNHRLKSDSESVKQLDHMKKQQQLRAMNKPFVPNKTMNADAMIENLLSNKDTFQKKKDNPIKAPMPPSWLVPDNSSVSPFYNQLWHLVRVSATGTATGTCQLADTSAVSSLLMTSGLSTDTLGFIWALANRTVPGSLTQAELYVVLALVSLAQSGYIFNDTSILNQIPQPPIPKLDLTILPQYNMNFSTQPSGVGTHYYQQPNPVAIDSTLATDRLDNSLTTKEPSPVSIVSLDVNKLQGASVLTLPNYNFGMSYQGFDAPLGAVVNNSNKNTTPVPSLGMPVYQEPSSAIPSISLGLSTPTKVNSSYQPPTKTGEIPVLDNDSTSQDISSDVVSFNSINKFKLDSPTKLPSLSQHVDVAASNLSKLNLSAGENRTVVENSTGQTSVDDSFDSLSSERASVGGQPKVPSAPNYNLDLFDLSDEVQHVFPDSGPGSTPQVEIVSNREQDVKKTLIDEDFDDEFTDFQSADFTSFNTAAVVAPLASLPETEVDVTKAIPVADSGFKPAVRKDVEEDDFTNFQEAPIPASDDDLFPKSVTINAPNEIGVKSAIENGCYEKSEPTNYSEWSDNTSNDWTVGSGGNEKDSDSLNYVDLSDIKLEIPTSDTEDVIRPHEVAPDGKGDKSDKEDKYSALRGLQPSQDVPTGEEFGDFLAAEPGEYQMPDMDANNSAVQIRCLEACLQILQESYSILTSASSPKVLSEVMSDPRTINHLTCLLEVFRVSERLIKHVENNDVVNQIQAIWNDILPLLEGSKCYQLEDTTGPVCDLCRCDYGPFPMKYGRSTFHAPCANLYLHYVDSTLPNSEAY